MVLSSLLGGVLGILFLIPFRKYFVKEMHGKYPFPEATATTQVLVSDRRIWIKKHCEAAHGDVLKDWDEANPYGD